MVRAMLTRTTESKCMFQIKLERTENARILGDQREQNKARVGLGKSFNSSRSSVGGTKDGPPQTRG